MSDAEYEKRMAAAYGEPEPTYKRPIVLSGLIWAFVIASLIVGLLALSGCTQTVIKGVCAFRHMGANENGVNFIQFQCEPQE